MKVVILAGGHGTRLSEETELNPKPMVLIGGRPILWHIMKIYSFYGFNDFIILTGYKSHIIKDYFINYYTRYSDITVDMSENSVEIHKTRTEPWKVTMLYTGQDTQTAGRIKKAQNYIGNERFFLTYGDGVADVDINKLLTYHLDKSVAATVTAVRPIGKFGNLDLGQNGNVENFIEKPDGDGGWINGGFFVLEPGVFDYIPENSNLIPFEQEPLISLADAQKLAAYKHFGFWKPMDTLRDKNELTGMWISGNAPWVVWG
jgi:glucose-1-phosphate cytidylyltransferase